jgi:hypothetical protein
MEVEYFDQFNQYMKGSCCQNHNLDIYFEKLGQKD